MADPPDGQPDGRLGDCDFGTEHIIGTPPLRIERSTKLN